MFNISERSWQYHTEVELVESPRSSHTVASVTPDALALGVRIRRQHLARQRARSAPPLAWLAHLEVSSCSIAYPMLTTHTNLCAADVVLTEINATPNIVYDTSADNGANARSCDFIFIFAMCNRLSHFELPPELEKISKEARAAWMLSSGDHSTVLALISRQFAESFTMAAEALNSNILCSPSQKILDPPELIFTSIFQYHHHLDSERPAMHHLHLALR
ncbi:hypothetical protein K438DRAFT_1986493 [Mycena galopus ATCC 62051]|nr:hypothetical protein K438DRAFT_1986493 [Mycena galopus ATCC 62051]